MKKYFAEFFGTLILVLFGTGVAVITKGDILATSLSFGLSLMIIIYIFGPISGAHVNPAVSIAMYLTKRLEKSDLIYYIIYQLLGAITGSSILFAILSNTNLGTMVMGANGYGPLSITNINVYGALFVEFVLTAIFVFTILLITSKEEYAKLQGIIIGSTLSLIHFISIPLTGTSVNPARSFAPALFIGGEALKQLWVFILAPTIGGIIASYLYKYFSNNKKV